jgi:GlpG protein
MRQIGQLEAERDAHRFVAFLVTTGISAQAEEDGEGWSIWVRDENSVDAARQAFQEFRAAPQDARYLDVERQAESILREENKRREEASKNVVEMRGKWNRGGSRRRPLTLALIGVCVLIGLITNMGDNQTGMPMRSLLFADWMRLAAMQPQIPTWEDTTLEIRQGEFWRLFTPNLVHYGPWHLAFNMIMFYQLGGLIEERRGTWRLALMILAIGVICNVAQCVVPIAWGGSPMAAGFSGVVFGLFGYAWMKSTFAPEMGMQLNRNAVMILLIWLFLGFSGILEQLGGLRVANWSHGIGLLVGIAIGYYPEIIRAFRSP